MSSTILYLAIVAIWAGVLVPRWLRREPHRETARRPLRAGTAPGGRSVGAAVGVAADGAIVASGIGAFGAADVRGADRGREVLVPQRASADAGRRPGTRRAGRARVMAARRRLFGILVLLAGAAATIAGAGLATWWVMVPPAGMLAGYLLLLREAARADAELARAGVVRTDVVRTDVAGSEVAGFEVARSDVGRSDVGRFEVARAGSAGAESEEERGAAARGGSRLRRRSAAMVDTGATGSVASPVAHTSSADHPVDDTDGTGADGTGSDGTGTEGTGTERTGTADVVPITARVDEELYDQYADAKLRAVGD